MEKVYGDTLLLDFYGQLLTKRQYKIMDLHFNDDYSLGEIALELNISRQGVYDSVKRSRGTLNRMEEKLGLVNKFTRQRAKAIELLDKIKILNKSNMSTEDIEILSFIEKGILQIIEG
ncbi:MAG: YlxM family DNA-binding protein [Clostridium sp.]|nr:YlxM family DNA-binding protein [Clostridium sp.]